MADRNHHSNPEQVRRLYRRLARNYDTFDAWWKLPTHKAYLALNRAFERHLSPNGRILDLGCGTVGADENVYRRFPGIVSLEHYAGGTAALTVLHKSEKPTEVQHA